MQNTNKSPEKSHFMSGFTLGTLAGGTMLYLFGTKKGRAVLSNLMDIAEQFEEGNLDFQGLLTQDEVKNKGVTKISSGGIQDVLEKIQEVIPGETIKKYFVKDES